MRLPPTIMMDALSMANPMFLPSHPMISILPRTIPDMIMKMNLHRHMKTIVMLTTTTFADMMTTVDTMMTDMMISIPNLLLIGELLSTFILFFSPLLILF